jgi:glutamyl-tRNA reductase
MQDYILVHRKRNGNPLELSVPIWSTCLRQIAFVKRDEFSELQEKIEAADETFEADAAVEFLLQVICGLKSPVLGETEVQGQFKQFVSDNIIFQKDLRGWGEALLSQAKRIRSLHIQNMGAGSYGSWLRKKIEAKAEVGIVGSGHLVGEILPWFKQIRCVRLYVRSPERTKSFQGIVPSMEIHGLNQIGSESHLVIAAPVENQWIVERARKYNRGCRILDFRGEGILGDSDQRDLKKLGHVYVGFSQILADIENEKIRVRKKMQMADAEIKTAVNDLHQRLWLRPGGWEDLCG